MAPGLELAVGQPLRGETQRERGQNVQDRPVPFIPAPKSGQERRHPRQAFWSLGAV